MKKINTNLVGLYTIVLREITRFIRIWSQTLLPSVISMALYFIIFGHVMGSRIGSIEGYTYIEYIAPGLIMMSIITNAYANVVSSFFGAKFQRHLEEMLVSPLPNYIILWGFIVGGLLRGILVGLLVTGISLFFTQLTLQHFWLTLLIGILTALLFSLAGFINGIFAEKFDDINIVPTFVLTPLTYLGGVFYSVHLLPDVWQWLTYINPVFYMVNGFRFGMLGKSDVDMSITLWVIAGFVGVLYGLSIWLLKKGIGIKT